MQNNLIAIDTDSLNSVTGGVTDSERALQTYLSASPANEDQAFKTFTAQNQGFIKRDAAMRDQGYGGSTAGFQGWFNNNRSPERMR